MTMKLRYSSSLQQLLVFLTITFSITSIQAETIQGKVVHIADGDTLRILTPSNQQIKIRLAGIDTPEKAQAFSNKAKQALAALIFQKQITVDVLTIDRYGRSVGRVYVKGFDVNAELVQQGYAWVYRKYTKDQKLYALKAEAKKAKRGLWSTDHPIPPWDWKKENMRLIIIQLW